MLFVEFEIKLEIFLGFGRLDKQTFPNRKMRFQNFKTSH